MPGYLREGLERGETSRSLKERPVYLRGRPRPLSEALVFQREAWVSQKEVYDEVYDNHRPEFAAHMTVHMLVHMTVHMQTWNLSQAEQTCLCKFYWFG